MEQKKEVKIPVPLKYLCNFWRSLEMPLIICKVELSLKWIEYFVLTTAAIDANADAADSATLKLLMHNVMFQLLHYRQKTIQNYQNY